MAPEPDRVVHFDTPEAFRAWLEEHHEVRDELWVGYWKKATGRPSMTWPESVDEALCFGWIDGIRRRIDDDAYTIRFTPRRPGSTWSLRNVERYRAMDEGGRVHPAGRAAFEARREERTGTYAYERAEPAPLPDDFEERLRAVPGAWTAWRAFPSSHRRRVRHWIASAKRADTRERRLEKLIADLEAGRG